MGTSALKFSVQLLPANVWFVNYFGLKFSPDFQNTEKLSRGVLQKQSFNINAVTKYLNFRSSAAKLESITCKYTKIRTPSEVVFEEFHNKSRTAILKNASRRLLLGTTLFSKYSSMAASQKTTAKINLLQKFQVKHDLHFLL